MNKNHFTTTIPLLNKLPPSPIFFDFNMKVILALLALVAAAVATDYHQSHHEHSHHYAPTEYYYDAPAYGHYGDHANTYVHRQPYSVHYDLKEYGPHGSSQHVNFEQKFGHGYNGYH